MVRVLETADQCFIGHLIYFYGISNYLDPIVFEQAKTTWYVAQYLIFERSLACLCYVLRSLIVSLLHACRVASPHQTHLSSCN